VPKIPGESRTVQPFVGTRPSFSNLKVGSVQTQTWCGKADLYQPGVCLDRVEQLSKLRITQYFCEIAAALDFVCLAKVLDAPKRLGR
jgi:hypothetical protein